MGSKSCGRRRCSAPDVRNSAARAETSAEGRREGVAELACGAGLLVPSTRAVAGTASAGLLVGVLPANVQMSVSFGRRAARTGRPVHRLAFLATVGRLPIQWPLIRVALRARQVTVGRPVAVQAPMPPSRW